MNEDVKVEQGSGNVLRMSDFLMLKPSERC